MNDTLTVPLDGLRAAEKQRLRDVAETCRRNRSIRLHFRSEAKEGDAKARDVIRDLATQHNRSERQIRRIIYDS